jgi:hypothetical protein
LAHRNVKKYYALTNKRKAEVQIANRYSRVRLLEKAKNALNRAHLKAKLKPTGAHSHLVAFAESTRLEDLRVPLDIHHFISESRDHPVNIFTFMHEKPQDPAKAVSV